MSIAEAPLEVYSISLLFAGEVDGPTYTLPFSKDNLPLSKRSALLFAALLISILLLPVLLGKFTYKPAVAGILKGVVVDIVKSVLGLVLL